MVQHGQYGRWSTARLIKYGLLPCMSRERAGNSKVNCAETLDSQLRLRLPTLDVHAGMHGSNGVPPASFFTLDDTRG